jgi:hypothetical protein
MRNRNPQKESIAKTVGFLNECREILNRDPWSFTVEDVRKRHHVAAVRFRIAKELGFFVNTEELGVYSCPYEKPFEPAHARQVHLEESRLRAIRKGSEKRRNDIGHIAFPEVNTIEAFPELKEANPDTYKQNGLSKYSDRVIAQEFRFRGLEILSDGSIIKRVL